MPKSTSTISTFAACMFGPLTFNSFNLKPVLASFYLEPCNFTSNIFQINKNDTVYESAWNYGLFKPTCISDISEVKNTFRVSFLYRKEVLRTESCINILPFLFRICEYKVLKYIELKSLHLII